MYLNLNILFVYFLGLVNKWRHGLWKDEIFCNNSDKALALNSVTKN